MQTAWVSTLAGKLSSHMMFGNQVWMLQLEKARAPQQTVLMQQQRPSAARKEKKRIVSVKNPELIRGRSNPIEHTLKHVWNFLNGKADGW